MFDKKSIDKALDKVFESVGSTKIFTPTQMLSKAKTDSSVTDELDEVVNTGQIKGYTVKNQIGWGGFGKLFLAEKDQEPYILKMPKTRGQLKQIHNEIEILNKLGQFTALMPHDNIVGIKESFDNFLVVEYLEESLNPLEAKIKKGLTKVIQKDSNIYNTQIHDTRIAKILVNLIDAVDYCHTNGVFHCDIKPENILFTHGKKTDSYGRERIYSTAKLFDFGSAFCLDWLNDYEKAKNHTDSATFNFLHKDYLKQAFKWGDKFSNKVPSEKKAHLVFRRRDYAAIGLSAYFLITGRVPYVNKNENPYKKQITLHHIMDSDSPVDYSEFRRINHGEMFEYFVKSCLNPESFSRARNIGKELKEMIKKAYPILKEK